MTPLTLSDRQQPADRTCGRSCVLETPFVVSVIYFLPMRYYRFNNYRPYSVFKYKKRKLPTKQLLNAYRWRKFIWILTEKCHLQHRAESLWTVALKCSRTTVCAGVRGTNFLVFHKVVNSPLTSGPQTVKGMNSHRQETKTSPIRWSHPI